ncbi:hypothetical protein HY68_12545 [Streptomyces sp. AcH 505]|uniref:hypothetical protein n=1 Tax=Streptomyces sp. AcH 505 TaxID=352211 RepID=UPI000591DFFB|nr:hypothetical protein HY68_12545 [Streptomyces sp. AcH 505]
MSDYRIQLITLLILTAVVLVTAARTVAAGRAADKAAARADAAFAKMKADLAEIDRRADRLLDDIKDRRSQP